MFSVERPSDFPKSLTKSTKNYRAFDVVEELQDIFWLNVIYVRDKDFLM